MTMNLPREAFQFLNFDLVKTLFHEFGHALNIGMSKTKYQYLSGARGTLDSIEIPSHFCELFLTDYSFVSQFALVQTPVRRPQFRDEEVEMKTEPINRSTFMKMLFCD